MQTRSKKIWMLGVIVSLALGLAYVRAADVAEDAADKRAGALVAAAETTFTRLFERYSRGQFDNLDTLYLWSRRALDAASLAHRGDRRALLAAAQAHEARMQRLDAVHAKLVAGGQATKSSASAMEYYVLESQVLADDARLEK